MNTIVVGYADSEASERALTRAAELAAALSARLVVVSVSRSTRVPVTAPVLEAEGPMVVPSVGGPFPAGGPVPLPEQEPRHEPEPAELAQRQLERARMSLAGKRVDVEFVGEVGDPVDRLLEIAEDRDADLIVVGSREHGLLERLLSRPVDETLARRAGRDVLLVH